MSPENEPNSVGNPEPVNSSDGEGLLVWLGSLLIVVAGGSVVFSTLVAPRRLSGATRWAKILWEKRQAEIQHVVSSQVGQAPAVQTAEAEPAKIGKD